MKMVEMVHVKTGIRAQIEEAYVPVHIRNGWERVEPKPAQAKPQVKPAQKSAPKKAPQRKRPAK